MLNPHCLLCLVKYLLLRKDLKGNHEKISSHNTVPQMAVPNKNLVSGKYSRNVHKFHFSFLGHFNFTVTSRKKWKNYFFHFPLLKKGESCACSPLFLEKKIYTLLRVAEVGSLSARAKIAMEIFVKCLFTIS